jgi:hypothetical protein
MLASDNKKELLIVNEQPDLMAEITQLDSDEGIPEIVWSMAIYDFNKQNISMATMDYSLVASHIQELCKSYSDTVGLEGYWHVTAGFSSLGMSKLDIENYQSPNTRVQVVIDNENNLDPLELNFHAMSVLISQTA